MRKILGLCVLCMLVTGCPAWVPGQAEAPVQLTGKVDWQVRHKGGVAEIAWSVTVVNNSTKESSLLIVSCLNAKGVVRAEDDVVCRLAPGESSTVLGIMDVPVTEIAGITQLVAYLVAAE